MFVANEPILRVTAPLHEAQLIETRPHQHSAFPVADRANEAKILAAQTRKTVTSRSLVGLRPRSVRIVRSRSQR